LFACEVNARAPDPPAAISPGAAVLPPALLAPTLGNPEDTQQVNWLAPATCPATTPLPQFTAETPFEIAPSVRVDAEPGGFRAIVAARANGHELQREFTAQTCPEINGAVLVSLSLLNATAQETPAPEPPQFAQFADVAPVDSASARPLGSDVPGERPATAERVEDVPRHTAEGAIAPPKVQSQRRVVADATPHGSSNPMTDGHQTDILTSASLLLGGGTEALQLWVGGGGAAVALGRGRWSGVFQVTGTWPVHAVTRRTVALDMWLGEPRFKVCRHQGATLRWSVCAAGFVTFLRASAPRIEQPGSDWT
jgi:hypothetical protein